MREPDRTAAQAPQSAVREQDRTAAQEPQFDAREQDQSVPIEKSPSVLSDEGQSPVNEEGPNKRVDLGRLGWLATVGICLIVVLILVLEGYLGYAAVTFAVALAAAINLA